MKTLVIFHDPGCGLCAGFRRWLEAQPKRVGVEFLAYNSAAAEARFPGIIGTGAARDVVVLADDGRWWQGTAAWITCLWVTRDYRDWAFRLASPALQPFVKKAVHLLSENRLTLSRLLRLQGDEAIASAISTMPAPAGENGACPL